MSDRLINHPERVIQSAEEQADVLVRVQDIDFSADMLAVIYTQAIGE